MDKKTVTQVVDQLATAASRDDRQSITDILAEVGKTAPRVAEVLAEEILSHGLHGMTR
ncbi:hypothetical protein ACFQ08_02430 [Streptosporangium algeriense]|uniref:Uncharacterized protein n=1 Tax=Streptosporangium algeriense TaxID=1682748 RepID=A0ABW3DKY4_9ACTN